jgi:uncharacterized protein
MKTQLIRSAAVLGFCLMFVPSIRAQETFNQPRIITVTGNAEIKVAPDEVTLTLGVDSHDKDLAVAKADNDKRIKRLLSLARAAGVESKNIKTSALTMGPEYSDEKIPKLLGYEVSQTVAVTLTDLSKYEDLMTGALNAGVNRVDGVNFFVGDPKKYREEARLEAVQAAHEKAIAMAGELRQTVGPPWEITEETEPDDMNSVAGLQSKLVLPQGEPTVAGGEVTIRATVQISFRLE